MTATAVAAPLDYAEQAKRCLARLNALATIIRHHHTHGQAIDLRLLRARLGDVIAVTLREEFGMSEEQKPKPVNTEEIRRMAQRVIAAARVPFEAPALTSELRVNTGQLLTRASAAVLRAHGALSKQDRLAALRALNEAQQAQARAMALLLGVRFDPSDDDDMLPAEVTP